MARPTCGGTRLWLRFEDRGGETIVRLEQQQPPWRVIRGFQTSSGEALTHLNNVSGGVLDTDDLRLRVDVDPLARAQITTTGATRVYRSRSDEAIARLQAAWHSFRAADTGRACYRPAGYARGCARQGAGRWCR